MLDLHPTFRMKKIALFVASDKSDHKLEPELGNDTERMKEECGSFIENITEFRKMADDLIDITDKVCL